MEVSQQMESCVNPQQGNNMSDLQQMKGSRQTTNQDTQISLQRENLSNHVLFRCFSQYSKRYKDFIDSFLSQHLSQIINNKYADILRSFWSAAFHFKPIKQELFDLSIEILKQIVDQQVEKITVNMSQKDRQYYELILKQTQQIIENLKKTDIIQIDLNVQHLIKIDILSLFFRVNNDIKTKYKEYFDGHTIHFKTLGKFFKINPVLLSVYNQKYIPYRQHIHYDYQENFNFILYFTLFLQMRKKMSKIIKVNKLKDPSFFINQDIVDQKPESAIQRQVTHPYLYKLCQVIFLTPGQKYDNLSPSKRYQIIDQLRFIQHIESYQLQKRQFLRIKCSHNLAFSSLQFVFAAVLKTNTEAIKRYQHELNIRNLLLQSQWIFVKDSDHYQIFQKLMNWHYKEVRMLEKQTYICDYLLKLAQKRLLLASYVMRAQIQFFKSQDQIENIYIHRFEYSFNNLKGIKQAQTPNSNDLNCTLILGANDSIIQFYIVSPQRYNNNQYSSQLRNIVQKLRKNDEKRYAVYLYQNELQYYFGIQQYRNLYRFINSRFQSYVFITNLSEKFYMHFLIHTCVKNYLNFIINKLTKDNLVENIKGIIMLVVNNLRKVYNQIKSKKKSIKNE